MRHSGVNGVGICDPAAPQIRLRISRHVVSSKGLPRELLMNRLSRLERFFLVALPLGPFGFLALVSIAKRGRDLTGLFFTGLALFLVGAILVVVIGFWKRSTRMENERPGSFWFSCGSCFLFACCSSLDWSQYDRCDGGGPRRIHQRTNPECRCSPFSRIRRGGPQRIRRPNR